MRIPSELGATASTYDASVMPTRERARALGLVVPVKGWFGRERDLLAEEPERTRQSVEVVVRALVTTRAIREADDEVGASTLVRLRDEHERPTERFVAATWRTLAARVDARTRRPCSSCSFTPGRSTCIGCDGRGVIVIGQGRSQEVRTCPGCSGKKSVACSRCDGAAETVIARVRTHEDRVGELEHVFSSLPEAIREAVSRHLLAATELDPAFVVDLDRPIVPRETGYRGEVLLETPHLFGVDVTITLGEARATLARLAASGTVVDRAQQAHAVPVCVLEYGSHDLALVASSHETMVAVMSAKE